MHIMQITWFLLLSNKTKNFMGNLEGGGENISRLVIQYIGDWQYDHVFGFLACKTLGYDSYKF